MTTAAATATQTIEISRVQLRDLGSIVALERLCFGREAWGWPDFLMSLPTPHIFIKASQDLRLVGFVLGWTRRRQGVTWITNIAVHPDARNQGLGRRLMLAVEEAAPTPRMRLTVRVDNDAARHLYRSLGYVDTHLRRGYYPGRVDGMEMEKAIETRGNS